MLSLICCGSVDLSLGVEKPETGLRWGPRVARLVMFLNLILLAALLYKAFGQSLTSSGGVTVALINSTPGPMLDLAFEYPGGKLAMPRLEMRGQVAHSVTNLADFEGTLSFRNEQGHRYQQKVRVRPYGEMLVLLDVQAVLKTSVIKSSEGKDETVVEASPTKVLVTRSYQRPGWETK